MKREHRVDHGHLYAPPDWQRDLLTRKDVMPPTNQTWPHGTTRDECIKLTCDALARTSVRRADALARELEGKSDAYTASRCRSIVTYNRLDVYVPTTAGAHPSDTSWPAGWDAASARAALAELGADLEDVPDDRLAAALIDAIRAGTLPARREPSANADVEAIADAVADKLAERSDADARADRAHAWRNQHIKPFRPGLPARPR